MCVNVVDEAPRASVPVPSAVEGPNRGAVVVVVVAVGNNGLPPKIEPVVESEGEVALAEKYKQNGINEPQFKRVTNDNCT